MQLKCVWFTICAALGFSALASAQVRQGSEGKHRSFYLSIGANSSSYSSPSLKVDAGTAQYELSSLKADNGTYTTPSAFVSKISYRLGYFFDCNQTTGVELAYDPFNYHLTDGSTVHLSGTLDKAPVSSDISFSSAHGYYYYVGFRQLNVNLVKRIPIYHPVQHVAGFDAMLRLGGGPIMTTFDAALPGGITEHNSSLLSGWNAGLDGGLRITMLRHVYVELSGKYDYSLLNDIKVNSGTVKQNITTIQFKAALGFTLPGNKNTRYLFYNVGRGPL